MNTVVMALCCSNEPVVMELMLKKSTSGMNVVNKTGRTSLHVSVGKQHADCVRMLLKYHCDVNVQVKTWSSFNQRPNKMLPGASTNGGLGDGSPTISKMGGLPRKDYTESV